ncbi:helix-turn-helix domain-containing protein [Rhizobium paknamense]|uniref:DNA-binding Lrp family transcriptional regulator n=1 Tax=Rhizobium paknamense TaxID=1206817 RepID=A0ABU0ICQ4_9HYPH|nr:helix-turn-helix domain-containing protein [Rhizobium paknamense]MDQ0456030.1 DNA-binding Lrp family transcriptional regulator [Rhizobium paknamense]
MSSNARFSIIPGWIVTDPRLRGRDLQILCLLGRHTDKQGWCRRSQVKMADQLGCARSTVQLSLDRLIEMGVVERHIVTVNDGRDTAHLYRVVYDRQPPQGYAFDADLDDDENEAELENCSNTPADQSAPPADISAPPADSGSAPPADPGSAPINDPLRTTLSERNGGRGREKQEEKKISSDLEGQEPQASRRAERERSERQFQRWFKTWPGLGDLEFARNAWMALSAEERAACVELTPVYLSWPGRKVTAPAVYLKNRAWEDMPADAAEQQGPTHGAAAYCGKLWMGRWFQELLSPPTGRFMITRTEEAQVSAGKISREALIREKRMRNGWPVANKMLDLARSCEPFVTSLALKPHVAGFQAVSRDSALFQAWQRLHERRGWPQIQKPLGHVWLPAVAPDASDLDAAVEAALANFEQAISEGRGKDAA